MVPIHDTDVAEERWSKSGWENYELWEKVELRLKRQKRLWIFATSVLFIALSSVPIMIDRWPKWVTRSITVKLAREINKMKREASIGRAAYRFRFLEGNGLNYVIERVQNCSTPSGDVIRSGSLASSSNNNKYFWLSPLQGDQMGIPELVSEFCYDYLAGSGTVLKGKDVVGLGIMPVIDLTEKKLDRLSLLLLSGPSAEISFD